MRKASRRTRSEAVCAIRFLRGSRTTGILQPLLPHSSEKASDITEGKEQATYFRDVVKVAMDELRAPADKLEMIVDKEFWPFPSYGDLLFEV